VARAAQADDERSKRVFIAIDLILALAFIAGIVTTSVTLTSFFAARSAPGAAVLTTATFMASTTQSATTAAITIEVSTVLTTQTLTVTTVTATSAQGSLVPASHYFAQMLTLILPQFYGYAALLSWGIFACALIWRGHVRTVWARGRFSYDTFRLLVRMRGAQTRLRLMHTLDGPKNKLQLASALGIDWKAVDKHVRALERNGLLQPTATSGTATFYELTEKGKRALQVLDELLVDGKEED
jgi:DNA-binding HxlR family transcriptional regulator